MNSENNSTMVSSYEPSYNSSDSPLLNDRMNYMQQNSYNQLPPVSSFNNMNNMNNNMNMNNMNNNMNNMNNMNNNNMNYNGNNMNYNNGNNMNQNRMNNGGNNNIQAKKFSFVNVTPNPQQKNGANGMERGINYKQKRKIINKTQYNELMRVFQITEKPSHDERARLARVLGMSVREVQVWFQNRRAKNKKGARNRSSTPPFISYKPNNSMGNGSNYGSEADSDKSSKGSPTMQKILPNPSQIKNSPTSSPSKPNIMQNDYQYQTPNNNWKNQQGQNPNSPQNMQDNENYPTPQPSPPHENPTNPPEPKQRGRPRGHYNKKDKNPNNASTSYSNNYGKSHKKIKLEGGQDEEIMAAAEALTSLSALFGGAPPIKNEFNSYNNNNSPYPMNGGNYNNNNNNYRPNNDYQDFNNQNQMNNNYDNNNNFNNNYSNNDDNYQRRDMYDNNNNNNNNYRDDNRMYNNNNNNYNNNNNFNNNNNNNNFNNSNNNNNNNNNNNGNTMPNNKFDDMNDQSDNRQDKELFHKPINYETRSKTRAKSESTFSIQKFVDKSNGGFNDSINMNKNEISNGPVSESNESNENYESNHRRPW